ncbi:hypothetical protein M422DRAFT_42524 [Sphaerobolus stellatus SS14]|nr:hypothetical protein M422DRAFT_42524 [Sphaerobolus stellatus SS14]
MVVFQRRFIYMGYVPLGSREEVVSQYKNLFSGIDLQEVKLNEADSKAILHGIVIRRQTDDNLRRPRIRATVIYMQGNAGNPLHRIPLFKSLLATCPELELTILAVAPRSYWKSTPRRPTERGIIQDYTQILQYALKQWPNDPVFLLGHSLGATISVCLTSQLPDNPRIGGLIIENPFSSIPDMVRALYTSRWLPYHHLGPLAFDKWDAVKATKEAPDSSLFRRLAREGKILGLQSELDEIVPVYMGAKICEAASVDKPVVIREALHENAWMTSKEWGKSIYAFLNKNIAR